MIDSMYLVKELNAREYVTVCENLQSYLKNFFPRQQLRRKVSKKGTQTAKTNALAVYGFREIILKRTRFGHRTIEIFFKPSMLLDRNGRYLLSKLSDFEDIEIGFDYVLRDILSLPVPSFKFWKARRIDLAVDVQVDETIVGKYIHLFKRSNIPEYFFQNPETHLYWNSTTNLYLCASTLVLNWYNRYETLEARERKSKKPYEDYKDTKGIIRIEVQLRECDQPLHKMLDAELIRKQIMQHFKLLIGAGSYYSFENAHSKIIDLVSSRKKRKEFVHLLSVVNQYGSVFEAKKEYSDPITGVKFSLDKFSKVINQLRRYGINPVIIPSEWDIQMLPNLINDIEVELSKNKVEIRHSH